MNFVPVWTIIGMPAKNGHDSQLAHASASSGEAKKGAPGEFSKTKSSEEIETLLGSSMRLPISISKPWRWRRRRQALRLAARALEHHG